MGIEFAPEAIEGGHAMLEAEQLHRHAARLGAEWFSTALSGVWARLSSDWATLGLNTPNYSAHQAEMEALRVLVAQEAAWSLRLRGGLEEAALSWRNHQAPALRTLSLMSEIELSAHLHAQQLAADLEQSLPDVLEASDRRVAGLAASLDMRPGAGNPWSPESVLRVFAQTLPLDDLSATLVPAAFDDLRRRLPGVLRDVLQRLSALLEGNGVVAAPAPPPTLVKPVESSLPRSVETEASRLSPHHASPDARVRPAGEPLPADISNASSGFGGGNPAGGQGTGSAHARNDSGLPRYRDIVHEHLANWRERAQAEGATQAPRMDGQGLHVLRSAEVMTMASVLQGEDPAPFTEALRRDGSASLQWVIREQMLKAAAQLGFDRDQTQFSPDDEDAIDLVAILFDTLAASNDLMPRGTEMFGKLVLPYVKVAMIDDSLFNRRTHPARRLLDALAESCDGNAGENVPNREILARAESVVEQVVSRFQEDQAIFELAAKELRDYLEQQRLRAEVAERRMAETLHGRERLHFARQDAHAALVALLEGRHVSVACQQFLEFVWQTALMNVWLRYGVDTPRYRNMQALGETLVELDAAGATLQASRLAEGFIGQLDALRECLSLCGRVGEAAEEAIARLCAGLADPDGERGPRKIMSPPALEETLDEASDMRIASQRASVEGEDQVLIARLRKLRVGQGLRVREEEGHESAAKIAWISPLTGRLLIVNRRGLRKMVVTPEELAVLVARGEVVVRAIEAPVDQAMRQVWEQLRASSAPTG